MKRAVAIAVGSVLILILASGLAGADRVPVAEWGLDADANRDGIADGWSANSDEDTASYSLTEGWGGSRAQHVLAGKPSDGVFRRIEGLDPSASYLLTAWLRVDKGGVIWGPENTAPKYAHGYGRWVEARQTFTGRSKVTLILYALLPDSEFSVDNLRLDRVDKTPLPIEKDTGNSLIPRPQRIEYRPGETESLTLTEATPFAVLGMSAAEINVDFFRRDLGFDGGPAICTARAAMATLKTPIVIGTAEALWAARESLPGALQTVVAQRRERLAEDGYWLHVGADGAIIAATDARSAFYGLMTLRRLCVEAAEGEYRAPRVFIYDWPEMPFRATYISGATMGDWRAGKAAECARMKMNAMVMEDGLFYELDNPDNVQRIRDFFAHLRSLHIEPIPLVQSFGWAGSVATIDADCVEAVWVRDKAMEFTTRADLAASVAATMPDDGRQYLVMPQSKTPLGQPVGNASFEAVEDGHPLDWHWDTWSVLDGVSLDRENRTEGAYAIRIDRTAERGVMRLWQDFDLPAQSSIRFSADMKVEDVKPGTAYMEIYRLDDAGELVGGPVVSSNRGVQTRAWRRTTMMLNTEDHTRFRIYLRIQDAQGTVWFDNLTLDRWNTLLRGLVRVGDSLKLTSQSGEVYTPGKDYEVIPGESEYPFEPEDKPWMIARLEGGRIPAGATVRMSYEYAPPGAITYCPSNPKTHAIMRKTLHNVATKLGISRIHMGHDEPRWMNRCKLCSERNMSNAELLAEELRRMHGFVREVAPDVRLMMWADALNPYHNAPHQQLEPANDHIPTDIIQCVWFYGARDDVREARGLAFFADKGFETTGSPWFDLENNWDWAQECALSRELTGKCLGVFYTSWGIQSTDPWAGLPVTAAFGWNADDPLAREMLPW